MHHQLPAHPDSAWARLRPAEQRVLALRLGQGLTADQVATATGWSVRRVRRVQLRALRRLAG